MSKKNRVRNPTGNRSFAKAGGRLPLIVNTGYSEGGASQNKSALRGYNPIKSSTKSDIDVNLPILRNRSNDMYCNSPIAASAINTSRANVIGAGLKVSPKIDYKLLGLSPDEAKDWQRHTMREFSLWADGVDCDLYRKNNFYDMQDIAFMNYLIDGDSWVAKKYRNPTFNNPYALRIQLFEATRVCNPNTIATNSPLNSYNVEQINPKNGNRIISGVEIDSDGSVVAYHISSRVPYDPCDNASTVVWTRVEAFGKITGEPNILQISHEERPEQYRGVPYLAPVIEELKQVSRYTNAELTAAIVKAFFTLFFTEQNAGGGLDDVLQNAYSEKEKLSPEDMNAFELGPGTLNLVPAGYDVKAIDASRSLSTFEPFTNTLISQVGAALGIPSEVLLNRFQSSYSAARAALLQASSVFKTRRVWFARDFCQPIYEAWLAEAVAIGRIKAKGFNDDPLLRKAWNGADWFGPVMGMLDPVKEVNGAALRVKYGFSTGEKEAAEITGTDYDNNVDQIAIEQNTWKNNGLVVPRVDKTGEIDMKGGDTSE